MRFFAFEKLEPAGSKSFCFFIVWRYFLIALIGKNIYWFRNELMVGSWPADVVSCRFRWHSGLPSEARFTGRSGDTSRDCFDMFQGLFFEAVWGVRLAAVLGLFWKGISTWFWGCVWEWNCEEFWEALEHRGHEFWPTSEFFLDPVLEHFFLKSGQKVDQKMDKIFVQNLATIFAQNLATGVGMHVKIHADRKSGISQLVPFFGQKSCPFSAPVFGQNRFWEIIFRIPRGREVANL